MRKLFCFILLLCGVTSCYPPRLIYALDDTCSIENDSIDIQLLKGSTTSLDAHTITSKLFIEVCNKSNSILTLNDNPQLETLVDSVTLYYELFENDHISNTKRDLLLSNVTYLKNTSVHGALHLYITFS